MNHGTSPMAQWIKNLPAMQETQETWVRSLGGEDPREWGTATHSSIPAWRIPWAEKPGRLWSLGHKELDTTEVTEHAACITDSLPCATET